jgi:tetrapyrrole methylase family protein/MazG family protein
MSVRGRVVVVGLGPAGPELVTAATLDALGRVPVRYVRTRRHPAAESFSWTGSFDEVYERAATFDDVYRDIVDALVAAADEHGEVLYAVPGSPRVAERSVALLLDDGRVDVEVLPALSFLDLAWVRLGVDPLAAGVRVVDGHDFAVQAAGERGPLLVSHCHSGDVLSDVKLALGDDLPDRVVVLQRLGAPDEAVFEVAGADLDRSF